MNMSIGLMWLCDAIADEACYNITRIQDRRRADTAAARNRWWKIYAAHPAVYQEAAAAVWSANVIIPAEASRRLPC